MYFNKILFISIIGIIKINSISGKPPRQCNNFDGITFDYLNEASEYFSTTTSIAYYPAPKDGKCFTFGIKTLNKFYVALTEKQENLMPDNKNIISGGGVIAEISNNKSALYNYKTLKFEEYSGKVTPNFTQSPAADYNDLFDKHHAEFWLTWNDDNFKVGQKGYQEPFLEAKLPMNYNVSYIQIMKGSADAKIKMERCKSCPDGTNIKYERIPLQDPLKCRISMTDTMITRLVKNDIYHTAYYLGPEYGKCFTFGVKSRSEFYVALTEKQENLMPDNKNIVSGGSVIAKISHSYGKNALYNYKTLEFEDSGKATPNFTFCEPEEINDYHVEYTDFWLTWSEDNFKLGQKGYEEPFLEANLPKNYDLGFIQIMKGSSDLIIKMEKCKSCPDGTNVIYEDRSPLVRIAH